MSLSSFGGSGAAVVGREVEAAVPRMLTKSPMPLRSYLGALLALFVLAATVALGFGWESAERDGLSAARADADFGAGKAAEQLGRSLAGVRSSVDAVATSPGAASVFDQAEDCRLSFSLGGPQDGHLDVVRSDGSVVCSSQPPGAGGVRDERPAYRPPSTWWSTH